jgi:hypothetical protein
MVWLSCASTKSSRSYTKRVDKVLGVLIREPSLRVGQVATEECCDKEYHMGDA